MIFKKLFFKKIYNNEKYKIKNSDVVNIKSLEYLASSINKKKIEIILTDDSFGGYYNNKFILPIYTTLNKKNFIKKILIYKIIFFTIAKKLNFYLKKKTNNLNYLSLISILITKTVNKKTKKIIPKIDTFRKHAYKILKKKTGEESLLYIIEDKILFFKRKYKIKLTQYEKFLLYKIENITKIHHKNLNNITNFIYKNINIKKEQTNLKINLINGYLYYKTKNYIEKKKYKTNKNKKLNKHKNSNNKIQKEIIKNKNNKNKNSLNSLFDYKKTTDKYKKNNQNKYKTDSNNFNEIPKSRLRNTIKTYKSQKIVEKNIVINNIKISNLIYKKSNIKKLAYKEWDYNVNEYKYNWCNLFIKKKKEISYNNKQFLIETKNKNINTIIYLKNKINLLKNKKQWKKRQINGEDLDFDTVIDNYKDISKENFNKIYKKKSKTQKDISILLLFDSSLSTDSFSYKNKIIKKIKELIVILSYSIEKKINYLIATFYSNTRHECTYKIIKNFNEKLKDINIKKIAPKGYTRIGPAIRHSINEIKKTKSKKKIIILITDGNPTDYDEYEGLYAIKDIKKALNEVKKNNITVSNIIINNNNKQLLKKMFNKNYIILEKKNIKEKIFNLIRKSILN